MNCARFSECVRDWIRGSAGEAMHAEMAEHAAACPECAAIGEEERLLSSALSALAASTSSSEAPEGVEQALLTEFRAGRRTQRNIRRFSWTAAVAAGIGLVAIVGNWSVLKPRLQAPPAVAEKRAGPVQTVPVQEAAPAPQPPAVERGAGARAASALTARVRSGRGVRRPVAPPARPEPLREYVTEFVPLRYGESLRLDDVAGVVRIAIPRSELARFGLPVAPEASGRRIQADVLLGVDGVARAMRFVKTETY